MCIRDRAEGGGGGTAFEVGNEQCPGFADAVAPVGDVVTVQSAAGLLGGITGLHLSLIHISSLVRDSLVVAFNFFALEYSRLCLLYTSRCV